MPQKANASSIRRWFPHYSRSEIYTMTMKDLKAKKGGNVSSLKNITFRCWPDLHEKLVKQSAETGLSLNELINRAVAASFDQPALIDALAKRMEVRQFEIERQLQEFRNKAAAGVHPRDWLKQASKDMEIT